MVLQILFLGPSNLLEPNASFSQMSQKLIVSPIVKTLVFSKVPEKASWSIVYMQFIHAVNLHLQSIIHLHVKSLASAYLLNLLGYSFLADSPSAATYKAVILSHLMHYLICNSSYSLKLTCSVLSSCDIHFKKLLNIIRLCL